MQTVSSVYYSPDRLSGGGCVAGLSYVMMVIIEMSPMFPHFHRVGQFCGFSGSSSPSQSTSSTRFESESMLMLSDFLVSLGLERSKYFFGFNRMLSS